MKSQFYRPCRIEDVETGEEYDAIFHRFEKESSVVFYKDDDGNPGSAVTSRIIGIVERTDGQIMIVNPEEIRFVDRFAERISDRYRVEVDE